MDLAGQGGNGFTREDVMTVMLSTKGLKKRIS